MQHHNVFETVSAVIFGGAIVIGLTVGWFYSTGFFLFAVASYMRSLSLRKEHLGLRGWAYMLFFLGIISLLWTFTV